MRNAIILCSGGLDSVVTAYYVRKRLRYDKIIILFFNYKQRALKQERKYSKICARKINAEFQEINIQELGRISDSWINNNNKKINKIKDLKDTKKESERYYVPCRNSVFLIYAMALAESLEMKTCYKWDIFTGFKNEGKEAYADTTLKYVKEMNNLIKISTKIKGIIKAPLIKKDKEDIIKFGQDIGVDFRDTFSCYAPKNNKHCGFCLACKLRKAGFYWAGIEDITHCS